MNDPDSGAWAEMVRPTRTGAHARSAGRRRRVALRGVAVAAGVALCGTLALGAGQTQTVALTGEGAPGTALGVDFSFFSNPVLNDAGQVAFRAFLIGSGVDTSNQQGIWRGEAGSLSLVSRAGSDAPGTAPGVKFFGSFGPVLNDSGQVAFYGFLTGSGVDSSNDEGIWRGGPGSLSLVARRGSAAPALGSGVNFSGFSNPVLNDTGQVAFLADVAGSGVDSSNSQGIWRGGPGSLSLVARRGSPAPDTGGNFSFLSTPVLNDAGQVAFYAGLTGSGVDSSNNEGIWRGGPGSLSLVARRGSAAPGTASGVNFSVFNVPMLNDAGQVAFWATLTGSGVDSSNHEGIWRGGPGSLSLVARRGSAAPGTASGVNFLSLSASPVLNDAGQVAFWASLTGSGVDTSNNNGIWRGDGDSLSLVARRGSAAPGTGSGVNFSIFSTPVLNDAGQVAFRANLTGSGVNSNNDLGLWIGDGSESLLVARKGEELAGRTISSLNLTTGSGGSDGRERAMNEFAQLTYRAGFTDGSEGVFLFTPEVRWRRTFGGSWDTAGNWTLSIPPGNPHQVFIDPATSLTVFGPRDAVTVKDLRIGGGNGIATLHLDGGVLTATEGVVIEPTGVLTGEGVIVGEVINHGTVLAENVTIPGLFNNHGIVRGSGRINAALNNAAGGTVRVGAGERLLVAPPSLANITNTGRIEVLGGEMEFTRAVVNGFRDFTGGPAIPGRIVARDAVLRFNGGLANVVGDVAFSFGTSDVFGMIINDSSARILLSSDTRVTFYDSVTNANQIILSGGARATFFGPVVNDGELRVSDGSTAVYFGAVSGSGSFTGTGTNFFEATLSPGSSPGTLAFEGDVAFGASAAVNMEIAGTTPRTQHDQIHVGGHLSLDGTLNVQLIDTYLPQEPAAFDLFSFASLSGTFSTINLPELSAGLLWNTAALYTDGVLSIIAELLPGDANRDGRVDGEDFLIWQASFGTQSGAMWEDGDFNGDGRVDGEDFLIWQAHFGSVPGGTAMTPEPAALSLLGLAVLAMLRRQRA